MGIVRHSRVENKKEENKPVKKADLFTPAEAAFLVSKLRQAQYTGAEFEQFYQIMAKLTSLANSEK